VSAASVIGRGALYAYQAVPPTGAQEDGSPRSRLAVVVSVRATNGSRCGRTAAANASFVKSCRSSAGSASGAAATAASGADPSCAASDVSRPCGVAAGNERFGGSIPRTRLM
jgi:hypothetical protein